MTSIRFAPLLCGHNPGMTHLTERHFVRCAYGVARRLLHVELEPANGSLAWRLHVAPAFAHDLDGAEDVDVSVSRDVDPMHVDRPWQVTWSPHGDGPFPSFAGTLTVRPDDDPDVAVLELDGTYDPALGLSGEAFDLLAGARLATTTAEALLRDLGTRILEKHAAEERARQATP